MTQRAAERHGVLAVDEYGRGVGTGNGLAAAGGVSQARGGEAIDQHIRGTGLDGRRAMSGDRAGGWVAQTSGGFG